MRRKVITEVGFNSGVNDAFTVWTDVSSDVSSISIPRGRSSELDSIEAGECTLVLDNTDGRYTPGRQWAGLLSESWFGFSASSSTVFSTTNGGVWRMSGLNDTGRSVTYNSTTSVLTAVSTTVPDNGYIDVILQTGNTQFTAPAGSRVRITYRARVLNATNQCEIKGKLFGASAASPSGNSLDGVTATATAGAWVTFSDVYTVPVGTEYLRPGVRAYHVAGTGGGSLTLEISSIVLETETLYGAKIKPRRPVRVTTVLDDNLIHFEAVRPGVYDLDKPRFTFTASSAITSVQDSILNAPTWSLYLSDPGVVRTAYVGAPGSSDVDSMWVKAGQTVVAYARVRVTDAAASATVKIAFSSTNLPVTVVSSSSAVSSTTWTTATVSYTAPADGAVRMLLTGLNSAVAAGPAARFVDLKLSIQSSEAGYSTSPQGASGMYPEFRGYVDSWTVGAEGFVSTATVRAVDYMGVASRPLKSFAREYVKYQEAQQRTAGKTGILNYWPCSDPTGSPTAQPLLGSGELAVLSNPAFPPATGGFTADRSIAAKDGASGGFTVQDSNLAKGAVLSMVNQGLPRVEAPAEFGFSMWVNAVIPTAGRACLMMWTNASNLRAIGLFLESNGSLTVEWGGDSPVLPEFTLNTLGTFTIQDRVPTFVHLYAVRSPASSAFVDVTIGKNLTQTVTGQAIQPTPQPMNIQVGGRYYGSISQDYFHGTISHVMFGTETVFMGLLPHAFAAGNTDAAWNESESLDWVLKFARFPLYTRLDTGRSVLAPPSWDSETDLSGIMLSLAEDGNGTFFFGPDGSAVFHDRYRRTMSEPRWTVAEFAGTLQFSLDTQYLLNSVTAERMDGVTGVVTDDAGIAEFGLRNRTFRRNVASVDELKQAAGWILHKYQESVPRIESFEVDASALEGGTVDTALIQLAHGGAISDKLRLTGLPVSAPAGTLDYFIEGVDKTITANGSRWDYRVSFRVSDASRSSAFILEDTTYGLLDGDSSVLVY